MRQRSTVLSLLLALSISWLLWPPPSQARAEDEATAAPEPGEASQAPEGSGEEGAESPEASEASPEERAEQRRAQGLEKGIKSAWWNRPDLLQALSLSEAKRSEMDGLYRSYLESREQGSAVGERRVAFVQSLGKGDWKHARSRLDDLVVENGAPVRAQGELKIAVLSLLSEEQLAKLVEDNADVLRRPWQAKGRSGGGRARPGGRRQGRL